MFILVHPCSSALVVFASCLSRDFDNRGALLHAQSGQVFLRCSGALGWLGALWPELPCAGSAARWARERPSFAWARLGRLHGCTSTLALALALALAMNLALALAPALLSAAFRRWLLSVCLSVVATATAAAAVSASSDPGPAVACIACIACAACTPGSGSRFEGVVEE